jgi:hypothetical protein
MDWTALTADEHQVRLARSVVGVVPLCGVNRAALAKAAQAAFGDPWKWTEIFPGGPTATIWFVSDISDASMRAAYRLAPAERMADVITERFAQNAGLKPFVKQVMRYDVCHPVQALARMQRTARAMYACKAFPGRPGIVRLAALNVIYTALVFYWLADRSPDNGRTKAATEAAMRVLRV